MFKFVGKGIKRIPFFQTFFVKTALRFSEELLRMKKISSCDANNANDGNSNKSIPAFFLENICTK